MKLWKIGGRIGVGTLVLLLLFSMPAFAQDDDDSATVWYATSFTGGGQNSLDGAVSGVSIGPNDTAMVSVFDPKSGTTRVTFYGVTLVSESEDTSTYPPTVIRPDDVAGGVTSWRITEIGFPQLTTIKNLRADYVNAGASVFVVYSGVTLTADMLAGGMLYTFNTSPIVLGIPTITGSTPYFMVADMAGGGVTVQTTDADPLYDSDTTDGTAYFVNAGNSRHQATFNLVYESGSCAFVHVIGTQGSNWDIE